MTTEPVDLVEQLSRLMKAHGVSYNVEREWVVPHGALAAARASWYARAGSGVLQVDVLLENKSVINECFAGIGDGADGIGDALQNFMANSLHVLLAAFWDRYDPEQVTTEAWMVSGKPFTAYIGNFGTRATPGVKPIVPAELFPTIKRTIERESLSSTCHWVRHYFGDAKGEQTFEALLDNEPWQAGLDAMRSLSWPRSSGYYGVRNFLVLKPAA